MSYVYLIHFTKRFKHAGHYVGYSSMLTYRIQCHRNNTGAKLLRAVNLAGIAWRVVRTWTVDSQELEWAIKCQKNTPRLCPICNPNIENFENSYKEQP